MSRRAKGPRLWLRPARADGTGSLWLILDGPSQRGTGFGPSELAGAEKALARYIGAKHTVTATTGVRDPSQIPIDDVLALYVRDVTPKHARPQETAKRIQILRVFWGKRTLDQVTGQTCRAYASSRSTPAAARRELEDLRSAINYHRTEGLHDRIVSVVLPAKSLPRERWLTRSEAAHLILTTWRYREQQNFRGTDRRTRKHVAKFMLVASYMGSRAAVICSASLAKKRPPGTAWIDLENGIFYGRPAGERETRKRKQTVRLPAPLLAHLRRWRARGQRYVVEWRYKPIGRVDQAHKRAVATAGFDRDITPHTWRHTAATWLMQAGTDIWIAAGFLGVTVEELERTYGHHHPEHSAGVRRQRYIKDRGEQKSISTHANVAKVTGNPTFWL